MADKEDKTMDLEVAIMEIEKDQTELHRKFKEAIESVVSNEGEVLPKNEEEVHALRVKMGILQKERVALYQRLTKIITEFEESISAKLNSGPSGTNAAGDDDTQKKPEDLKNI